MKEFELTLIVLSFVGVAYLLGRVSSMERQIKGLNWTSEKHYDWLVIHSSDLAHLKRIVKVTETREVVE